MEYYDADQKDVDLAVAGFPERGCLIYIFSTARYGYHKPIYMHHYRLETFPFTKYILYGNGTWRSNYSPG
jgi:hypothetical protein